MFRNFLVKMVPLKNDMNLRKNTTYMKVHILNGYNQKTPERWKFIIKENYKNATNLITHDHHLIKGSRVITLDELASTEIYSILFYRSPK